MRRICEVPGDEAEENAQRPEVLRSAVLVIPAGTLFLDETAFRSVLWGVLAGRSERASWKAGRVVGSSTPTG